MRARASPSRQDIAVKPRPCVRGKFIWVGEKKLYIRGVTYGTFRPDEHGNQYHDVDLIDRDFAAMAANGINAVRLYDLPLHALLDTAERHGLGVVVDLAADQYVGHLTDRKGTDIGALIRAKVRAVAGHPAILAYSLGNEIPAALVRWHGRARIERYLRHLYGVARAEDPGALITYVNYPSTEYLELPFLDFYCFNVYLESPPRFEAYLARLQNLVGDFPLVMGEIGFDSFRNGEQAQARVLDWQIRTAFAGGCAGAFVYSWTDDWYRGGADAEDWAFGITRRDRSPKPALTAAGEAFTGVPLAPGGRWRPRISVVVCTYNGSRTIRECCEGLRRLDYDNFEVIVVDDGSTDGAPEIPRAYGFRVIRTANHGLSSARNTGLQAATGEIVAYIDDDAWPDPQWLSYLAHAFMHTGYAAIGGSNIPPPARGAIAECIASAPGGPVHVLVSDLEAEHIPGCNMAFRRTELAAIGGFDPEFRVAGDDVDVCWRLKDSGRTIGFCPAAMVWHHRRGSVRAYWKQQREYGKAEALLESKWPEKYNPAGHVSWAGRVYGHGGARRIWSRGRIYQGTWGCAPFQSIYEPARGVWSSLPLMPEWYLLIPAFGGVSSLGFLWQPLVLALPFLVLTIAVPLLQSGVNAARARFSGRPRRRIVLLAMRVLMAVLHTLQPAARLTGRLSHGLTPWRRRAPFGFALPWRRTFSFWFERWRSPHERLQSLESTLRAAGAVVIRGGDFDRWDLEVRTSISGVARILMAVEEHGLGRQLVRFRLWPRPSVAGVVVSAGVLVLALAAARDGAWAAAGILGCVAAIVTTCIIQACAHATSALLVLMEEQQHHVTAANAVTLDTPESGGVAEQALSASTRFPEWVRAGRR